MSQEQIEGDGEDEASTEDEVEAEKMPLIEHLVELRNRLLWSIGALIVGFVLCYFVAEEIYAFLVQPLADVMEGQPGRRLIYTGLHEAFFTYLKVAFFGSVCLTFPIVAGQLWAFVAPGLYKMERRAFLPFLLATPVLFLLGASLVYYLIFPLAWQFFLSFESPGGPGTLAIPKKAHISKLILHTIF